MISSGSGVDHLRACKLRALLDYLLNSIEEVTRGGNLPPSANSEHTGLDGKERHFHTLLMTQHILTSVETDRSSAPVVLGHNRAIKSKRMSRSTLILEGHRRIHQETLDYEQRNY